MERWIMVTSESKINKTGSKVARPGTKASLTMIVMQYFGRFCLPFTGNASKKVAH